MLIECRGAAFAYETGTVLEGLSFHVNEGDYLCILGENGAGKSTLMKGLLRMKAPSKGSLYFNASLRRNAVGYLPQQTAVQKDFPASALEVVLSGRLNHSRFRPFYSAADKAAAMENLRRLGADGLAGESYRSLSGGQQQRVLLARALCATERLLLLDEPAAGLDPQVTAELYRLIADINREMGVTIVMVSHDVQCAMQQAKSILHLRHAQLFFGTVEEYRATEAYRELTGCGTPPEAKC